MLGRDDEKCQDENESNTASASAVAIDRLVVGCALAISAMLSPYLLISTLHVENSACRFAISAPFVLYLFRTL